MDRSLPISGKFLTLVALFLTALPLRAQTSHYALAVSTQANRSAASFLRNASVLTGLAYVFTSPAAAINVNPPAIASVCYFLDRPATGTANHCEFDTPYDFKGTLLCGTATCGGAWDTSALPDGWHTLTQVVTLTTGGTEVDTAEFRVYNGSQLSLNASYDNGSPVAGIVVLQMLSSGNTAATIATLPLTSGAASCKLVLQIDAVYAVAVLGANGSLLASFPFILPSVLKVDPATLRSAALNLVFRSADQSVKQVTPQVSFAF